MFNVSAPWTRSWKRIAATALLVGNLAMITTTVFALDLNGSGSDVGEYCALDQPETTEACIVDLCHNRATGAEAAECARKARIRARFVLSTS